MRATNQEEKATRRKGVTKGVKDANDVVNVTERL